MDAALSCVDAEGILKPSSHGGVKDSNDVNGVSVNLRPLTLPVQ